MCFVQKAGDDDMMCSLIVTLIGMLISLIVTLIGMLISLIVTLTGMFFHPGRFYACSTHTLAVNVISKRVAEDKSFMYYVNDGVYGSFNCILFEEITLKPAVLKVRGTSIKVLLQVQPKHVLHTI